jgi:hypothetical protein
MQVGITGAMLSFFLRLTLITTRHFSPPFISHRRRQQVFLWGPELFSFIQLLNYNGRAVQIMSAAASAAAILDVRFAERANKDMFLTQ